MAQTPITPAKQGLYDPAFEKDACGIGFVAHLKGQKSHRIIEKGLALLTGLTHRGAEGCDPCTGDGAGILLQIPHDFLKEKFNSPSIQLPAAGQYGVGMIFMPAEAKAQKQCETLIRDLIKEEEMACVGWRDVPVCRDTVGPQAQASMPAIRQVFISARASQDPHFFNETFERKLYILRKRIESALKLHKDFYVVSLSCRTVIYKGLLRPDQVADFYPDLKDPTLMSAMALVHSRFSTNTFPTWSLAHPFRYICHNGEINTVQGNRHWMRARQGKLSSELFGEKLEELFPIISEGQSDSACLDNALEFLVMGGRSLPHAMMMLIPEPWNANPEMDLDRRGFYEYHSAMMEPWDGPAAVCFTDGKIIGATLDRNGLRP